jgi:hypothetical protein
MAEKRLCGGDGASIFCDDVAGAFESVGGNFMAPGFEVGDCCVAQELDFGPMRGQDAAGFLDLGAAGGVAVAGDGVLDHGVGDDQGDVGGMGARRKLRSRQSRSRA